MIAQVLTTVAATLANSPPPKLPGFLNAVGSQLNHYGYWAVLLLVLIEDFGIPVPGETVLIAASIYAGAGRLNVVAVGVIGFVAAVVGDNIGFAIGHFGGRALALRWGRYIFLTEERLNRGQAFFERHGGKIIVVARFIEGLRQANGIIAGISGMHWRRFLGFNMLGAALWVGTWVSLGYLAGNHISTIYHYITNYSLYALIALVVLLVLFIIRHILRRRRATQAVVAREEPGASKDPEAKRKLGTSEELEAEGESEAEGELEADGELGELKAGGELEIGQAAAEADAGPETAEESESRESSRTEENSHIPESSRAPESSGTLEHEP